MRSLLAVCLSAIMMMGAAEAATIDGNFNVVAGVPETYTFSFDLLPGEKFGSVKSFSVNSVLQKNTTFSLGPTGKGQLSFASSFGTADKVMSVFAEINLITTGYFLRCADGAEGVYYGTCGSYMDVWNGLENTSVVEFFALRTLSVMSEKTAPKEFLSAAEPAATVVPIAGTLPLLLSGLGILGWAARRRARVLA